MGERFIVWGLVFSFVLPYRPVLAADNLTDLRKHAGDIFDAKCNGCHSWDGEEGDPYKIFDPNGRPFLSVTGKRGDAKGKPSAALLDLVLKAVNHAAGVRPMPRRKPKDSDLEALQEWARAEKAEFVKTHPPPPPPPSGHSGPTCTQIDDSAKARRNGPLVTDAEAYGILETSCSHCHGHTGSFSSGEKVIAGVGLMSGLGMLALLAKGKWFDADTSPRETASLGNVSFESLSTGQMCRIVLKRLVRPSKLKILGSLAAISFAAIAGGQALKFAHAYDSFQFGNGAFDPASFAAEVQSLASVHGAVASGKMPIRSPLMPKILSDKDREKLLQWFDQLEQTDLPEGCQVLAQGNLGYEAASLACSKAGMRIPTAEQAQKLSSQAGNLFSGGGCVWTSSFTRDPKAPRKVIQGGAVASIGTRSSCRTVCLR